GPHQVGNRDRNRDCAPAAPHRPRLDRSDVGVPARRRDHDIPCHGHRDHRHGGGVERRRRRRRSDRPVHRAFVARHRPRHGQKPRQRHPVGHADASKSATATVTVTVPSGGVSVTIRPASITINESTGVTFTATVAGAQDTSVTWSLREGLSGGFFDQRGNYTSPADVGVFHLAATSNADPGAFATAAITVTYPYTPEETLVDHGG